MSTIREILRVLFAGGMSYRQIGCVSVPVITQSVVTTD